MSKENPTSFNDLDTETLRKTALEDFAVDIKADDNKKTILAALVEDGVTFDQYAKLKGLNTVKSNAPTPPKVGPVVSEVPEQEVEIVTAQPITDGPQQKWLLKMERDNVRYDVRGHKFTAEHPYALVSPQDAEYILNHEKGFRQAFPSELEEFYS